MFLMKPLRAGPAMTAPASSAAILIAPGAKKPLFVQVHKTAWVAEVASMVVAMTPALRTMTAHRDSHVMLASAAAPAIRENASKMMNASHR